MRVLVSTEETQGKRQDDFCFVPEGELVIFGIECTGEPVDDPCGCKRSVIGVESRKSTTTFKVAELDIEEDKLIEQIAKSEKIAFDASDEEARQWARQHAHRIQQIARMFKPGTVLERRADRLMVRKNPLKN